MHGSDIDYLVMRSDTTLTCLTYVFIVGFASEYRHTLGSQAQCNSIVRKIVGIWPVGGTIQASQTTLETTHDPFWEKMEFGDEVWEWSLLIVFSGPHF